MIFQNLFQIEVVGSSGNANPHFKKDWVDIESDAQKFGEAEFDRQNTSADVECKFPSARIIEVYYQKINTESEPQYIITQMKQKQEEVTWTFTNSKDPKENRSQKFQAMVAVNFYEVKQEIKLFKPVAVRGFSAKRNTLYPFYVYG